MNMVEQNIADAFLLSPYEARVYVVGLQSGPASLSDIARLAEISRTAVYPPLQSLVKRGLMAQIKKGKRSQYQSIEAKYLPALLDERKIKLQAALEALPQMISAPKNQFSAHYFMSAQGLKMAGELFLGQSKKGGTWKTFENPLYPLQIVGEDGFEDYIKRRVEKKIRARVITTVDINSKWIQKRLENQKKDLTEVITVSPREYPLNASLATDGETIYMLTAKERPYVLIIRNKDMAQTFGAIHDMVWDRYRDREDVIS